MKRVRQSFRSTLLPYLDIPLQKIGMYSQYRLSENERIGYYDSGLTSLIERLEDLGYEYKTLSASKLHPKRDISDSGSYRRIPEEHPDINEDAKILNWSPKSTQYHVHLFEVDDTIEVFSHYELMPDVLTKSVSINRLKTHYRPVWESEYIEGIAESEIQTLLEG